LIAPYIAATKNDSISKQNLNNQHENNSSPVDAANKGNMDSAPRIATSSKPDQIQVHGHPDHGWGQDAKLDNHRSKRNRARHHANNTNANVANNDGNFVFPSVSQGKSYAAKIKQLRLLAATRAN
jgi:hypothetical protein